MWQAAIMVAGAVLGEIGKSQQRRAQNKAAQMQIDKNYEAANKNIKSLERQARQAAQTQQGDVALRRIQAAEARSAAEINAGVEGQTIELYKDKALRDLEVDLGGSSYKFDLYNSNILQQADEIAYNTNMQNEAIAAGAPGKSSGLDMISSGLNIASAYYSGLNTSNANTLAKNKNQSRLNTSFSTNDLTIE